MWIGQQKPDGNIPAWIFYLINEQEVEPMRGIITKCLIEMNSQKMFEEAASSGSQKSSAQSESSD